MEGPPFVVEAGERSVHAWSTRRLSYAANDWRATFRAALSDALAGLQPVEGHGLGATYRSFEPGLGDDAENLLFYNLQSRRALRAGADAIAFRWLCEAPLAPPIGPRYDHGYDYALEPVPDWHAEMAAAEPLAVVESELLDPRRAFHPDRVWLAVKRGSIVTRPAPVPAQFGLAVEIDMPERRAIKAGSIIKEVFDGVIAALQRHADAGTLPEAARRLATRLGESDDLVATCLSAESTAALGVVPQLLRTPGDAKVLWNPADHGCVRGILGIRLGGSTCRLRARAWALDPKVQAPSPGSGS